MTSYFSSPYDSLSATEKRILETSTFLFARHGFDGTSMRMITSQAAVNLAAVNYHFGTKESLFQKVILPRLAIINEKRIELLNEAIAQAGSSAVSASRLLDCFLTPAQAMADDIEQGGDVFMQLLGRVYTEPAPFVQSVVQNGYTEVIPLYLAALRKSLSHISNSEVTWRFHFMCGAISYAYSGLDVFDLTDGYGVTGKRIKSRLLAFLTEGVNCPDSASG